VRKRPYFLKNFPPLWISILFLLIFWVSYFWDMGMNHPGKSYHGIRMVLICGGAAFFAFRRVFGFFPYPAGAYGKWLALTPWRYGMQMPKGPIQLNLTDVVIVGALCLFTQLDKKLSPAVPLMIFLYIYIFTAVFSTVLGIDPTKYWRKRILILIIAPLAFYPEPSIQNALLALTACYVLCYLYLRDVLKDYPWNTISWLVKQDEVLTFQSMKLPMSGWPYCVLASEKQNPFRIKNKAVNTIVFSVLLVWWLHASLSLFCSFKAGSGLLVAVIMLFAIFTIVLRMVLLKTGTASPISFWGRIFNGYFIIPRHDQIFVAPLLIIAILILAVTSMPDSGRGTIFLTDLSVFAILMIGMFCPPRIRQWFNTGAFRFVKNKTQEKQLGQIANQKNVLNKPIKEILLGK